MRVVVALGVVVLVVAAWTVPLPWVVESPAEIVAAGDAVVVRLDPASGQRRPPRLTGQYLATHRRGRSSFAAAVMGLVAPGQTVRRLDPQSADVLAQVGTVAALRGLGLSPARMEGAALPVEVRVAATLDPAALAAALHIFDTTSALDVARGRTIAATGEVAADESLRCVPGAADAVAAAKRAGAQVVVVPTDCEDVAGGAGTVVAATLTKAVERLLQP